ncbi:MAG: outer membrane beta-barrel protein, partial [Bacteroidota bacterium]
MQGKERKQGPEIDQAFIDRSWNEMAQLLDQELPTAPKPARRKRYALLLLLLLIGFGAGLSASYFLDRSDVQSPQQKNEAAPSKEIYANQEKLAPSTEVSDQTISNDASLSNSAPPTITPRASTKSAEQPIQQRTKSLQKTGVKPSSVESAQPPNEQAFDARETELEQTAIMALDLNSPSSGLDNHPARTDQNPIPVSPLHTEQQATMGAETSNPKLLKTSPLLTSWMLSLPSLAVPHTGSPIDRLEKTDVSWTDQLQVVSNTKNRWRFGLLAGVHLDQNGFGGWTAGTNLEYRLNRVWSFQSGIALTSLRKSIVFDQAQLDGQRLLSEEEMEEMDEFNGGTNSGIPIQPNLFLVDGENNFSLQRLHYLTIPLLVSYRVNSLFRVNFGVSWAYRVDNFNPFSGGQNDLALVEADPLASGGGELFTQISEERILDAGIRRSDWTGILGLGFDLTPQTGLDLRYNWGWQDYSLDEVFTSGSKDYNRSLQFSLVHYFG